MSQHPFKVLEDYLVDSRYTIQQPLSEKPGRITLLAQDQETQMNVVIKLLMFDGSLQWADLRLFRREVEVLKSLSHPSLPKYIDSFEVDSPSLKGIALVQASIEGKPLSHYLQVGQTFSEGELKQLALGILDVLSYLHQRNPPIIHRDIKPSNILLKNRSNHHIGEIYLVDFGSVQSPEVSQRNTMTIVGTYGYMAPEQFGRRATPASDLYSLGATIIYLATGCHPADLPQKALQIQFQSQASHLSESMQAWLTWLTQPGTDERPKSALEASNALREGQLGKWVDPQHSRSIQRGQSNHSILYRMAGALTLSLVALVSGLKLAVQQQPAEIGSVGSENTEIRPAGSENTEFGVNGRVTTDLGGAEGIRNLIQLKDGNFIAVGVQNTDIGRKWVLARYHRNGTLDTTFGVDGKTSISIPSADHINGINATVFVASQQDRKLILAGQQQIVRYNFDGTLDATFGNKGKVETGTTEVLNLAVQDDGQIIISGSQPLGPPANSDSNFPQPTFSLRRYTIDGQLDTTFGTDGIVKTIVNTNEIINSGGHGVTVQSDGRVIAVGSSLTNMRADFDIAVVRYLPDGSLDPEFGNNGVVITALSPSFDAARSVVVQPDGKIVVAGYALATLDGAFTVVRYNPDGSLDKSFGKDGTVITHLDVTNRRFRVEVALQKDGKIILVGTTAQTVTGGQGALEDYEFSILRYNSDGRLDSSFGEQGIVQTNLSPDIDAAYDVVVDLQENIVVAGTSSNDFALINYLSGKQQ